MRSKLLGAIIGIIAAVAAMQVPAHASYPGSNGKLAFVENGDIFTMSPSGGSLHQLTSGGDSYHPVWSPRGDRIAFNRHKSLYVIKPDGSRLHRINTGTVWGTDPTWSPDETQLAFAGIDGNIYQVAVAGGTPVQLTHDRTSTCPSPDAYPNYSPARQEIVFIRRCGKTESVTLLDVRSRSETVILPVPSPSYLYTPRFTSDGESIDFITTCTYPSSRGCFYNNNIGQNVVQINRDGSRWVFLTNYTDQNSGAADPAPAPNDIGSTFAWTLLDIDNPPRIVIGWPANGPLIPGSEPDWQPIAN